MYQSGIATPIYQNTKTGSPEGMKIPAENDASTTSYYFRVYFPGADQWLNSNYFSVTRKYTEISAVNLTNSAPEVGKTPNDMTYSADSGLAEGGYWFFPQANAQGGSMAATDTFEDGKTYSAAYRFTIPSTAGKVFAPTVTASNGTVYQVNRVDDTTIEVRVNFDPIGSGVTTYSVSIVTPIANGTVTASPNSGISAGDLVTLIVTPDPGYVLESIIVKDDETNLVTMETVNTFRMPASNVSVDATFKEAPISSHTVTFNTNGGSVVPEQTVTDGATVTKPDDPTKDGYTFDGWYQDATFAAAFDFDTPITTDVTLYAKWKDNGGGIVIPVTYVTVTGGNGTWTKNSGLNYELTVKRSVDDSTCFSHFVGVLMDGAVLTPGTDYDAKAGSTVIRLKASALQKLSAGSHTLTVNFDDGRADTTLTVKAATAAADKDTTPKTGDNNLIGMWFALMLLSLAGTCGTVVLGRKRRNEK